MDHRVNDLTEGSLPRKILLFSLPLVISNILQVLFNMSDLAVVGRFSGPEALGAVGSTTQFVMMFTGFFLGIGSGINVIAARYCGAKRREELSETVCTSAWLSVAIGLALLAVGVFTAVPVLQLLQTKSELIEGAACYLRIYFLGMPAVGLFNFGSAVYSAAGNTRKPLLFLGIAGVLNILLNLFFVIVCGMDVDGVAIASVISQYLSAALVVGSLLRSREGFALRLFGKFRLLRAREVLSIGLPAAVQNMIFQVANLFTQSGVNYFDAILVEGNSAAANADSLIYDVMAAFYTACSSFMGQNYGANKPKRVLHSYYWSLAYSFGAAAVLGGLLVLFGRPFLMIFTSDAAVVEAGMLRIRIMGWSYMISAFMDCTISACRGLGKNLVPTIVVILGSCVFRIAWIFTVFAWFHTIPSLYLLYAFSWVITAIPEICYFVHTYRKFAAEAANP